MRTTNPEVGACRSIYTMNMQGSDKGFSDSGLHSNGKFIHTSHGILLHKAAVVRCVVSFILQLEGGKDKG